MQIQPFEIDGPLLIRGMRHRDERGTFAEVYRSESFSNLGIPNFVQDNVSVSKKGVFRGLHWQSPPMEQGKLVSCFHGEIVDYVVDIRRSSPTFGQWISVILSDSENLSFWVPPGFAHGFQSNVNNSIVSYKVTQYWSSEHENSLSPLDPSISLKFQTKSVILSEKDRESPSLEQHSGLFE